MTSIQTEAIEVWYGHQQHIITVVLFVLLKFSTLFEVFFIYAALVLNMSILLLFFFLAGQEILLQMTSSSPEANITKKKMLFPDEIAQNDGPRNNTQLKTAIRGMGQRRITNRTPSHYPNPKRVKDKNFNNISQKNLCGGQEFCENPDVYPTALKEGMQTEGRSASSYVSNSPIDILPSQLREMDGDKETPVCVSIHEYIIPKRAITKDNNYRFIINSEKFGNSSLVQKVLIGKCHSPGSECTLGSNIKPSDYGLKTVCRQNYTFKRLLAVSDSGEEMVDSFKFPSCCVCHYKEEIRRRNASSTRVIDSSIKKTKY
ncbi:unnamed protein product [Lepeophtheirus salmonis]|uniref:(salmon louse) hypothetical protein n=1 Tax=Lepeophtheirus salmonis TaxID=72036 RepID=A0A7R8D1Q2_LEPSM|nr:unnamed protein product [Lepeophtheirus salmonis]CAF2971041.1 unnamed protein product [Lepeophtheirus salmonis]